MRLEIEGKMAGRINVSSVKYTPGRAKKSIGNEPTADGGSPRAACIGSVNRSCIGIRKTQAARSCRSHHIKDEEGAHAVVAEALPHLREEKRAQAARMARPTGHIGLFDFDSCHISSIILSVDAGVVQ